MLKSAVRKIYQKVLPYEARRRFYERREDRRVLAAGVRCDVCGGRDIVRHRNAVLSRLPYVFYRCRGCSFIFVHPKPDPTAHYEEGAVPRLGEGEPQWNAYYMECIERHAGGRGGRLLEVGFGNASFLRLAHERGWEAHGLDLGAPRVRHAREEMGLEHVRQETVESARYPEGFFDVVAAFNFIEHVTDPRATLGELGRVLRPGGLLALLCPNIAGVYHQLIPEVFGDKDPLNISWVPPEHLSYFNKENFRLLLEGAGFEVLGDYSRRTNLLWLQHRPTIGPEATEERLARLIGEMEASETPPGEARLAEFRARVTELLLQRLAWTYVSDVMRLEPALGSENAVFYVSRKAPGA